MKQQKLLSALAACCLSMGVAYAQETDLSAQRSEVQTILKVPGKKVDHRGLIINPMPQQMNVDGSGVLNISAGVKLKDKTGKFASKLSFLPSVGKGLPLTISVKPVSTKKQQPVAGSYSLVINKKGITITANDESGAFYGLQTLRQIVESPISKGGTSVPYLSITDYPDMPYRGVVEGFYGTPWSHEVRLSLIEFYGRNKMNTYIYGPKDDTYHSTPNWRLPYPEKEGKNIHELVEACRQNYVDFVWAIHPGQDIKWNDEDYQNLVKKFNLMYDYGVRSFAIFFDDISGEGTNPMKQVELLNRLTKEFVQAKGDVTPLIVCPTDYTKLWANPSPEGALSVYGRHLDPSIKVFWTGDVVCSDIDHSTLDWVNSRIQRPAFVWWNFAVTDYVRHIVLQGPVYGLETTLSNKDMSGFVSNPMEHGEASKLSLYSVADYTWNTAGYNAMDSWERGLAAVGLEAKDAYRTFAIHSADTETGYRRDESWETEIFRYGNYTQAQYDALYREFEKVAQVPAEMEKRCRNKALLKELKPWLTEFGKLGVRGQKALKLMTLFKEDDMKNFWTNYVDNMMSKDDRKAYEAHRSGTMKLQPFYEMAMVDLAEAFYKKLTGEMPFINRAFTSFPNGFTTLGNLMFDGDDNSFYTSAESQRTNSWIGVDLGQETSIKEIRILQGRNSVDDVDYFDNATLEYSADGKTWNTIIDEMSKQYDIHWKSDAVLKGRFVRLRKLPSEKKNWAAIRTFAVNPVRAENLGFALKADELEKAVLAFDRQPATVYSHKGICEFGVEKGVKAYSFLLKLKGGQMSVKQLDKKGKLVDECILDSDYSRLNLNPGTVKVVLTGEASIFEIVPHKN